MRNSIYQIFKALRHFGVEPKEVGKIAEAYKIWLKHPIEDVRQDYRIAYYYRGVFYAMPFLIEPLKNNFVGIEHNKVIYLIDNSYWIGEEGINFTLRYIKSRILYLPGSEDAQESSFEIELPTAKQLVQLRNFLNGTGLEKIHSEKTLSEIGIHCTMPLWVTDDEDPSKRITLDFNYVNPKPVYRTRNSLQPMIRMRKGVDFIGKVTYFGVPNKKTIEVYEALLKSLEH